MLKVTIELWPFGDDTKRKVIAEVEIWNDGNHPDRPMFGNYKGVFHAPGRQTRHLQIADHARGLGAWVLLERFLDLMMRVCHPGAKDPGSSGGI